ncbi:MAG: hypothetical protein JO127_17155 [Caulobacteraceae bacterium]|nr:hypothetical protein [Caulobacteraceae bacterium]
MSSNEHGPEITPVRARQGSGGRRLFWVLTGSTALAIVAIIGAWSLWGGSLSRPHNGGEEAPANQVVRFSTQPMAPRQS